MHLHGDLALTAYFWSELCRIATVYGWKNGRRVRARGPWRDGAVDTCSRYATSDMIGLVVRVGVHRIIHVSHAFGGESVGHVEVQRT